MIKNIENTYIVAKLLYDNLGDKYSFISLLMIANPFMAAADDFIKRENISNTSKSESDDFVDAFKNPFKILEQEFKNMRLDESSDWSID